MPLCASGRGFTILCEIENSKQSQSNGNKNEDEKKMIRQEEAEGKSRWHVDDVDDE